MDTNTEQGESLDNVRAIDGNKLELSRTQQATRFVFSSTTAFAGQKAGEVLFDAAVRAIRARRAG